MDPSEDFPPPPALFPPPAPAAAAPPPASTAASLVGPRIFVLSPLPGNKYEVDRYFYSARADVTTGDYAALLAFATHYAYPLAILQCPDLAAFQASNPDATTVRPFAEVPAPIIERGRALMLSSAASAASPSGGSASSQSLLSLSTSLPSAGANAHESSSVRGHDPPLVAALTRTSSLPVSHTFAPPFPPRCPDPDGVDGPSFVFGMGSSGGFGRLSGPPGGLGGMGYRRASARLTPVSGFSDYSSNNDDFRSYNFPCPIPETIPPVVFHRHGAPPPPGVSVPSPTMGYHHGPASVANGVRLLNGCHPILRRVSRLAGIKPLLARVSVPFAIVRRNRGTSLPTALSSRS